MTTKEKIRGRGTVAGYRVDIAKMPINHMGVCTRCRITIRPGRLFSFEGDTHLKAVCAGCAPITNSTIPTPRAS